MSGYEVHIRGLGVGARHVQARTLPQGYCTLEAAARARTTLEIAAARALAARGIATPWLHVHTWITVDGGPLAASDEAHAAEMHAGRMWRAHRWPSMKAQPAAKRGRKKNPGRSPGLMR